MDDAVKTVSELTREIQGTLEASFPSVGVSGEVSNCHPARSGHVYLTLKDEGAANHVLAEPDGVGNGLHPNACVCGEAAMVPTEHVIDGIAPDKVFF